jgi:hypothetical protein
LYIIKANGLHVALQRASPKSVIYLFQNKPVLVVFIQFKLKDTWDSKLIYKDVDMMDNSKCPLQ